MAQVNIRIDDYLKEEGDPFFSASNMNVLQASIADMDAGRGIVRKTIEDLEAMDNE